MPEPSHKPKINRVPDSFRAKENRDYLLAYDFVFSDNIEDWIHNRKRRESSRKPKGNNPQTPQP